MHRRSHVMAIKDVLKVSRKTFLNPREWIGYDAIKDQTKTIWDILKALFTPAKPEREETFEQAMQRLELTEADVKTRGQTYFIYALSFLLLSIIAFFVDCYLLIYYHIISGFFLGLAVTLLLATQAFRFHFWYFQIKHRKLGCTFQEWRNGKINKPEEPTS